ncbi:alpha/beta fold hydrolase [Streptomyces nanshensis]|uniref:alpha/beta fold hydrolase n=1 Tax=Streptomyces nanshensis TaxID=518642 RepID=UPI0026C15F08
MAGLAPYDAEGLDWYAGMVPSSAASLRAAAEGRAAKEAYEAGAAYDPDMFTDADHEALASTWSWFDEVVGPALEGGPDAPITDDLAYVAPWGFDPATITAPLLLLHGEEDRIAPAAHSRWLAEHCPTAELRLRPGAGHISVLEAGAEALEWLAARKG